MRIVLGTLYGLLALAGAAATAGGAAGGRLLRGRRLLAEVGAAQGSHEPGFTPPSCAECLDFAQLLLDDLRAAYPHKAKVVHSRRSDLSWRPLRCRLSST